MKIPLDTIAKTAESLTLEELQAQKNVRDAEVQALRAEMAAIHEVMEPKWARDQRLAAAPANLRQMLGGVK